MKERCTIIVPCYNEEKRLNLEDFSIFIKNILNFYFFLLTMAAMIIQEKFLENFVQIIPMLLN